jgi:hypothetical protein
MAKKKASPLIKLHKLPDVQFDSHTWVDYIELMCMLSPDQEVSTYDVSERFRRGSDLGEGAAAEAWDSEEPEKGDGDAGSGPEASDKEQLRVEDLFAHLRYREEAFGAAYPFRLSEDGDTLFVKNRLTLRQKLYLSLLLSANTAYVTRGASKLTSSFEIISSLALKELLPPYAEVYVFGSNSSGRHSRYRGNVLEKVRKLAEDLNEKIDLEEGDLPPTSSGDEGLDLVGWVPWSDAAPGRLLIFGQCACTGNWVMKQHSSSAQAWNRKIRFTARPANIAFIPLCFRRPDGSWHKPGDIHESIVIDRLRLIYLLRDQVDAFRKQASYAVVEEAIKQREVLY